MNIIKVHSPCFPYIWDDKYKNYYIMKNLLLISGLILLLLVNSSCEKIIKIKTYPTEYTVDSFLVSTLKLPKGEIFYQYTPATKVAYSKIVTLDTVNNCYKIYQYNQIGTYVGEGEMVRNIELKLMLIIE